MMKQRLIDQVIDATGGKWPSNDFRCRAQKTLITRAEFEARKAERQNKPDWKGHEYKFIQQGKNGHWYGSKNGNPSMLPDYLTGDDWNYINIASSRHGEVIGDHRDTLEQRPNHIVESDEKGDFDFEALANQFDDADDINAVWALRDKLHHKNKPEPSPELSFHLSNAFNELQASARLLPEDDPRRASIVSLAGGVSAVKEVA